MTDEERRAMVLERLRGARLFALVQKIAKEYGTTVEQIAGPTSRHHSQKHTNAARFAVWAAIRAQGKFSMEEIGHIFDRDHTTVLYGLRKCGIGGEHPPRRKPMTADVRLGLALALDIAMLPPRDVAKKWRTVGAKPPELAHAVAAAKAWFDSVV